MKLRLQLLLLVVMFSGCATVDPKLIMAKNTKVVIRDVTTNWHVSRAVANGDTEVRHIIKRIMINTKEELAKRGIEAFTTPITDSAVIKYDIRTINSGHRVIGTGFTVIGKDTYEVKYRVSLESPDGKELWVDKDEQDDSDLDDVFEKIARRVAKKVSRYFAESN